MEDFQSILICFFTNYQQVKRNAGKENVQAIKHMFNYRDFQ